MKFSLSSIRALATQWQTSADPTDMARSKLIDLIGSQLGAIEETAEIGQKYQGLIIAKVNSVKPHPNADKLSVCLIDDGGVIKQIKRQDSLVQVVCGAPNVRAGQLVVWLPPGEVVPASFGNQELKLEARDIRGVTSYGMIASAKELDISDDHSGILVLDGDIKPGLSFNQAFNLDDDLVIDIENKMFTHRPDLFGWLGIARELAGIQGLSFKSPAWYSLSPERLNVGPDKLKLSLKNELPKLVPRLMLLPMSRVKVDNSPVWLQLELVKAGIRPINNIVDITNYTMVLTGQPLHAYDYDKLRALSQAEAAIVVRNPMSGESVKLLGGKVIKPGSNAIMIATDKSLIGVGGIMGGAETEVDSKTRNIVLECGNFDMYSVKRTAMKEGLFTDATTRFTKGQSPLQNKACLMLAADLVWRYGGGQAAGQLLDSNNLPARVLRGGNLQPPVRVKPDFINQRLGLKLKMSEIRKLLTNVEFQVSGQKELTIRAPFWRTDILYPEDIVEEVGRLYGYDHLPLRLPVRHINPSRPDPMLSAKSGIRSALSRLGANEVLTYSFVAGQLLRDVGQDPKKAYKLANALSPELQYYRLSLVPSLLAKVHPNLKAGYDQFGLFEIGKINSLENGLDEDGLPREFEISAMVVAASDKLKKTDPAFYQAKLYLSKLARVELEFKEIPDQMKTYSIVQPYHPSRRAMVSLTTSGQFLGIVGEFKPSLAQALKLPSYCAGWEVDTAVLAEARKASLIYQPLPRYPKLTQDLTLKVKASTNYSELKRAVRAQLDNQLDKSYLYSLKPLDIYRPSRSDSKNISFRLEIANYQRTLSDKEVNRLLDDLIAGLKKRLVVSRV